MPSSHTVYLLGVGQQFPEHITVETASRLAESERIYTLLTHEQIDVLPASLSRKCVPLHWLYRRDRSRLESYQAIASTILAAAVELSVVSYLTLGSPRVLDTVSQLLLEGAGPRVSIVPLCAISSFDSVLSDVGYDPANGVQVLEANQALLYRIPLFAGCACLMMQPSMFGTDKPRFEPESPAADLTLLRDYLLRVWAPNHPAAFVVSSRSAAGHTQIVWTTIGELSDTEPRFVRGASLFIPPARRAVFDASFAARMVESPFA